MAHAPVLAEWSAAMTALWIPVHYYIRWAQDCRLSHAQDHARTTRNAR